MQGRHVDRFMPRQAGFLHHRSDEPIRRRDASGKAGMIHHIGDAARNHHRHAVASAAQYGRPLRHARAAHAVRNQRNLAVVFRFEDEAKQFGRQMNAVGNDLHIQLVKQVCALHNTQNAVPHAAGDGGHAGVQMRDMGEAML